ncbi:MAG: glycyl-radical enzyme activating protein [Deltaproteobacteria bacterium]|nr:glycyl-radical enzyme activating protein [Deltaproteobacteria bacterium]
MKKDLKGMVFNIQLHSTEDGPGIRTSIFMKGCSMHCPWCHNPESIKQVPQLIWYEQRCIGSAECLKACPKQALKLTPEGLAINRTLCNACGDCVAACPAGALEVIGQMYTVDDLVAKALQDRVFYEKSGGGVTLSGGEPSMQADFCAALMKKLKAEGIHIALDTCGGMSWTKLGRLVDLADLVLYDLKLMDSSNHQKLTGIPLELVLENSRRIAQAGKPIWVRTPIIPGINNTEENIRQTALFIKQNLPTAERYDLLAFNKTCTSKYERLGHDWRFEKEDLIRQATMEKLAETAREEGLTNVHWSGLTKE